MKFKIFFLLLFSLPLFILNSAHAAPKRVEPEKPATIKVLLQKESDGILLEAHGPFIVYNPENERKLSSGRRGKRFFCHPHNEGIKWGEDFLGIFQLQLQPTSPETTFLVNGVQYRGAIEIYHVENKLNVINEVDVESYVKSILTEKIQSSFPREVLDSLAIIARTDAYYSAQRSPQAFWHVVAEDVSYNGFGLAFQNLAVDYAVDNTRYLIMKYDEKPFPGTWTKHCGGKTAAYTSIFRKAAATPAGITSSFAMQGRKNSHWKFIIDTQELAKVVKTNRVTGMDLFIDHFSSKVYAVRFHDGMHTEDVSFSDLQKALGSDKLKSNDFAVNIKGNIASFEGHGEGVGVGLCLFSAMQMAERGDKTPEILSAFFPHTQLEKMRAYPDDTPSKQKNGHGLSKKQNPLKKKHRLLNR